MELYRPIQPKRPRAHAGFDVSAPPDSSYALALVNPDFISPLYVDPQVPTEQAIFSCGHCSGFQIQPDTPIEYSQKRRRLDNYVLMPQQHMSSSTQGHYHEKIPAADPHDAQDHGHISYMPRWATPSTGDSQSLSSRVARLLCPLCGCGWSQSGGYQHLPEMPAVVYEPNEPYSVEEAPSMTIQHPRQYIPVDQEPQQHGPFCGSDYSSSGPSLLESYPVLDQFPLQLPLTDTNGGSFQPSPPASEYYSESLANQDSSLLNPAIAFPMAPVLAVDQTAMHYGPDLFNVPNYPPMVDPNAVVPRTFNQYGFMAVDGLPDPASLAWSGPATREYEGNYNGLSPNQRATKRGPFRNQRLREQTAQTRRIGSCVRCRMQRIRCENNPDEPGGGCLTCKKVSNTKAGRLPCLRYKITDIRLYKPGPVPGYEWTRRWSNNISDPIQTWASSEIKVIRICEGYSTKYLELRVREFVPQEGDKLERTWDYNGTKKSVAIPPYALMDLQEANAAYNKYIRNSTSDMIRSLLGRQGSGLVHRTYLLVWQMWRDQSTPNEVREVLDWTLRLWTSIRLSTTSGFIVGEERLGMPSDILDETSPNPGKIPVPPVLGAQMDLVLIHHIQEKLRRVLLDKLQKMVLKNKQSCWLVTYLVTFILLHNASLITAHDAGYARKHGMNRRFAREDKVQEYHLGANILLAHFHYCNKGLHPFSDECRDQDLRTLAQLDESKIQFVHLTRGYAKQHKEEWVQLQASGAYEDDFFFVSQLFEAGWQPRSTVV